MIAMHTTPFALRRLGVVMTPDPDDPREAWGVLNPGGVRGPDGAYTLFPRLVAAGNFSRIGRARVVADPQGIPVGVARAGLALEPREPYEVGRLGGGVEDPRVTYLQPVGVYAMLYTAYTAHRPRIALAVSRDLVTWERLGPLRFVTAPGQVDLMECPNKDGLLFPEAVPDPQGRPALAIIHRPTLPAPPPGTAATPAKPETGLTPQEAIWISFSPLEGAGALHDLTHLHTHRLLLAPQATWEAIKVGGGAPPVRLPYGWLLLYHGVAGGLPAAAVPRRYCAGAAVLALDDPTRLLYRSPRPILEPEEPHETRGMVPQVVFPTATDLHPDGHLDVYYGAADSVIGVARLTVPTSLPAQEETPWTR